MPACARSEVVRDGEIGVYHVWCQCVRRAFLCGVDRLTGHNYDYRRRWIQEFEKRLAGLYGLEIGFHVEMSNHLHLILRSRPDVVETWTDQEVVRRARPGRSNSGLPGDIAPSRECLGLTFEKRRGIFGVATK